MTGERNEIGTPKWGGNKQWLGLGCAADMHGGRGGGRQPLWGKSGMTFVNAEISASYKRKNDPGPEIFREHAGVSERLCAARVGGLVSMQTGCMSSKEVLVCMRGSTAMVWMLQW